MRKARQCIIDRSELIWELVKGKLGEPPELDHNLDFEEFTDEVEEFASGEEMRVGEGDTFAQWNSTSSTPTGAGPQHIHPRRAWRRPRGRSRSTSVSPRAILSRNMNSGGLRLRG